MTPQQAYRICYKENKRKPELEPIILTDTYSSFWYTRCVIRKRWVEAEPVILTNPYYSYFYAIDIIKRRWKEAELVIEKDGVYWKYYCDHFNIKKDKINWIIGL